MNSVAFYKSFNLYKFEEGEGLRERRGTRTEAQAKQSEAELSEARARESEEEKGRSETNTRATPPYIGSETWQTSEWEMVGRTAAYKFIRQVL